MKSSGFYVDPNILPFFACLGETKNPDFAWKSGFYYLLLFFKVVPPGIEPGTQGFSVLCSTNWAMAPSFFGCKDRVKSLISKINETKMRKNNFLWKKLVFLLLVLKICLPLQRKRKNKRCNRNVAQLVAHYVRDVGVGRSSRLIPTEGDKQWKLLVAFVLSSL